MAITFKLFDALIEHKYGVSVYDTSVKREQLDEVRIWCKETFGERNFTGSFRQFYFKTEDARTLFILRWS